MQSENIESFLAKAHQGDLEAQYRVGLYYYNLRAQPPKPTFKRVTPQSVLDQIGSFNPRKPSTDIQPDKMEAFHWLHKAAKKNHPEAQNKLGDLFFYHYGDGSGPDTIRAFDWYQRAVTNGSIGAHFNLGWCYWEGEGTVTNKGKGLAYVIKAIELSYAPALSFFADLCAAGEYVPLNIGGAVLMHQEALFRGYRKARKRISALLACGKEEKENGTRLYCFPDGSVVRKTPQGLQNEHARRPQPALVSLGVPVAYDKAGLIRRVALRALSGKNPNP